MGHARRPARGALARILLALLGLTGLASAQIGRPLPASELEGFSQTGAQSLGDLTGRTVLIEFFAYW